MAKTKIGNLQGGAGPKGDKGDQGLPGVNAVENATAVAAYINSPGNATHDALAKGFARREYTNFPDDIGGMYKLPNFTAAVAAVRAGTRDAKVLCIGDSTTTGRGGSTDIAGSFPQQKGWPARFGDRLHKWIVPTAPGLAIPKPGASSQPSDSRWTPGTGWFQSSLAVGFTNQQVNWDCAPGGGDLLFNDPRIDADRFDIYYIVNTTAGSGTFTATATGGAPVVVPTGSQSARETRKVTVSAGINATTNIVSIHNSGASSNVFIVGIEPWKVGVRKVRVGNAGVSGSTSGGWVAVESGGYEGWNSLGFIKAYAPDLTIIDLGVNDAGNSVPTATFIANIQQLITAAQSVNSDILIKTMLPSSPAINVQFENLYVPALRGLGFPWVDGYTHYGPWATANANGFMYDSVHANDAGYSDVGDFMFAAISTVI